MSFTGEKAFHLYETFGLPLDFMVDAARDAGVAFDSEGFEKARAEEQARARASWKGGSQKTASPAFRDLPKTTFEGYRQLNSTNCEVLAIVKGGVGVPAAAAGTRLRSCWIIRASTAIQAGRSATRACSLPPTAIRPSPKSSAAFFQCKESARTRPCSSSLWPWAIT